MKNMRKPNPDHDGETDSLVHHIHLMLRNAPERIVTFIAARRGEGTSTVARQFAEGLAAQTERKVLLIDAGALDMERFITDGIDPTAGIVEAVASNGDTAQAIHTIDHNVYLGRWLGREDNRGLAGKLLHNEELWASLRGTYDVIVIDAPSLQDAGDGISFAVRAAAVVLVVEAETTRQPVIEKLRDVLTAAGAKIAGSVMNKRRLLIPDRIYARL